jgi:hypothetical protein
MSKINFSKTTGLVEFFGTISATDLQICDSKKKPGTRYVVFKCAGGKEETTMIAKSITAIDASNVTALQVSWIEGTTDAGEALEGYMVHPVGERKVISTFSLADLTAAVGIK